MFNLWEYWNRFRKRQATRRMPLRARLSVEPLELRLVPTTRVWDGGALDNSIFSPENWSDDTVPTFEDTMIFDGTSTKDATLEGYGHLYADQMYVMADYTGTISGELGYLTVNYLYQEGGALSWSGDLEVSNRFDWVGGTQGGSGLTFLGQEAVLAISGANYKYLDGRTLETEAYAVWSGTGSVFVSNGGSISNSGTFDIQTDAYLGDSSGSGTDGTFHNGGTITKSAGSGTTTLALTFNNYSATVTVQTGALDFQGGGILAGGTFWTNSPDAVLLLTDGTYEVTGEFTSGGAGLIVFGTAEDLGEGGKEGAGKQLFIVLSPQADGLKYNQEGNLTFEGGFIKGRGIFTQKTGTLTWKQGFMQKEGVIIPGGARTVIETGAAMRVEGAGDKLLVEWTIENKAAGEVKLENTVVKYRRVGSIENQGRFVMTGASRILRDEVQPVIFESFVNSGDFFKDGAGAAEIRMPFSNLAYFDLREGTLNLSGGLTQASSNGRIFLNGNTLSAAGTLRIIGGVLIGPGTLNANLALEGGEISFISRGALNVNGNYTQHAGTRLILRFEGAQYDSVQITGTATLAGTLQVLGSDTAPPDTYAAMLFASLQGQFDVEDVGEFFVLYLENGVGLWKP